PTTCRLSLQGRCGRAEGRPGKDANRSRSTLNNELIFLLGLALDRFDAADAAVCPISERTKALLAAAKARGKRLGGPRLAAARRASIKMEGAPPGGVGSVFALFRVTLLKMLGQSEDDLSWPPDVRWSAERTQSEMSGPP